MKSITTWLKSDTHTATTVTVTEKNAAQWSPESAPLQSYNYDDAAIPYDSTYYLYDYIANKNVLNQLSVTNWSEA